MVYDEAPGRAIDEFIDRVRSAKSSGKQVVEAFKAARRETSVGRDYLAEAQAEQRLSRRACQELEESIEAGRVLFGDSVADSLTRRVDRAMGTLENACCRYEQAVGQLTRERDDWKRWCQAAEERAEAQGNRADALAVVLRRAMVDAGRWAGKKKGRRTPGFVKAASVLLDDELEGDR